MFSVESISSQESEKLESDGSLSEKSEYIQNSFNKDSNSYPAEPSVTAEDNMNMNNSLHLNTTSPSEEISFSESGKNTSDQNSESSDQNEDEMPPLIDNENVTNQNLMDQEKKSAMDKCENNDLSFKSNPEPINVSMNPDNVKENDVKDECLREINQEKTCAGEDAEKEEEEYLDILGNGSLKRKVLHSIRIAVWLNWIVILIYFSKLFPQQCVYTCIPVYDCLQDIWLMQVVQYRLNKDVFFFQILRAAAKNAKRPISSDLVTIKVEGELEDGTKVDVYDSLSFVLGDGDVIQGGNIFYFKMILVDVSFTTVFWYAGLSEKALYSFNCTLIPGNMYFKNMTLTSMYAF